MSIGLISGVYGGYDIPRPLIPDHGFDQAVLVTDQKGLEVEGWEVIYEPLPKYIPRTAARKIKCLPMRYLDTDMSVWADGSIQPLNDGLSRDAKDLLSNENELLSFKHPFLNSWYEEAAFCINHPKYKDQRLKEQVHSYLSYGFPPESNKHFQNNLTFRVHNRRMEVFGEIWWNQIKEWSHQDQVSMPYSIWVMNIQAEYLPYHADHSPWFKRISHVDGT